MIRLFYSGKGKSQVLLQKKTMADTFESIDKACDYLVDVLKVNDAEVDNAIISMHANKHRVATFTAEGTLQSTGFY